MDKNSLVLDIMNAVADNTSVSNKPLPAAQEIIQNQAIKQNKPLPMWGRKLLQTVVPMLVIMVVAMVLIMPGLLLKSNNMLPSDNPGEGIQPPLNPDEDQSQGDYDYGFSNLIQIDYPSNTWWSAVQIDGDYTVRGSYRYIYNNAKLDVYEQEFILEAYANIKVKIIAISNDITVDMRQFKLGENTIIGKEMHTVAKASTSNYVYYIELVSGKPIASGDVLSSIDVGGRWMYN